ncbi:MAG: amidohydrolase [Frankiales bacterium]|nr:amidohydrolase [Frankiales bacterium]
MLITNISDSRTCVRVVGATVTAVSPDLTPERGEEVVDAAGGALLPGLHDHHVHLLALARADTSVDVRAGLDALRDLPGTGWLRAVGLTADLDGAALDAVVADRPVRVQHRSGAMWVVNGPGARALDLASCTEPGVERHADGSPTGRLWRLDAWLGDRLGHPDAPPDLAGLGRRLARLGITGVTDATATLTGPAAALLGSGALPQHLQVLADPVAGALLGPRKIVLADHDLPAFDDLLAMIRDARTEQRAVAAHCVTRVALVLFLAALEDVGPHRGDRVEHAAVTDPDSTATMARLGVTVVTQPGFLADRGDDYLADVAPEDQPHLYPYASLLAAGVPTVASSDAPHGPVDPWQVMAAARDRVALSGAVVGAGERVPVTTALDGYLRPLGDPSATARRVAPGAAADLVLLDVPLAEALRDPSAEHVVRTWISGTQVPVS